MARGGQAGVLDGDEGRADGQLGVAGHDLDGLAVVLGHEALGGEVGNLAPEGAAEARGVDPGDGAETGAALEEALPEGVDAGAESRRRCRGR
ncbi:MAG: hypothetical protein HND58_01250 [Planctomycetota bacterium]|nr:MAG: hypothetical protein HND58_01250 [Planctomycetota bacterium]